MDDPWWIGANNKVVNPTAKSDRSALQVTTIESITPLDAQHGMFPKKSVPDSLHAVLFGKSGSASPSMELTEASSIVALTMHTYAILEAAKIRNLPELLDGSGLEYRCLFKGDAYDKLKDVAPWIVRLEEDNALTRSLFTRGDAHWHLWDLDPGIYVRSIASLDAMWRHFRKFTMLFSKEKQNWHYFRFYSSEALRGIIANFDIAQFNSFAGPSHSVIGRTRDSGIMHISRPTPSADIL